jgi:uncharacterized membrane protein YkvI
MGAPWRVSRLRAIFRSYLLPGLVFTAAVIGGGYATGRELVQYFLSTGPVGGLLGMLVSMAVFSLVLAVSFELARVNRSYDYQSFIHGLLGRGAVIFEIAYVAMLIVILSVLGAAAGAAAHETLGVPAIFGTLSLMAATGAFVFLGSPVIEALLAFVAIVLYAAYGAIVGWSVHLFGPDIVGALQAGKADGWATSGLIYAGYNLAVLPAVLFALRHQTTRKQALVAGALAGPLAMIPALLLFVAMLGRYPAIEAQDLPLNYLLGQFQAPWFAHGFQVLFFAILIKSGTALLHSLNERVSGLFTAVGKTMPRGYRPLISILAMGFSIFAASRIGLVGLIKEGYGLLSWVFIAVLVVPVLTLGVWRIWRAPPRPKSGR